MKKQVTNKLKGKLICRNLPCSASSLSAIKINDSFDTDV